MEEKLRMIMNEKLRTIADHYGLKNQLRQLAEECSELAVEANHSARKGSVTVRLIEEIADVEIMIEQIRYLAKIQESDIVQTKFYKINRQTERILREVEGDADM